MYNGFGIDSSSTNSYSQDALELTNGNIVLTYAKYNSGYMNAVSKYIILEPIRLEAQYN